MVVAAESNRYRGMTSPEDEKGKAGGGGKEEVEEFEDYHITEEELLHQHGK